jgi:hypothetical protein
MHGLAVVAQVPPARTVRDNRRSSPVPPRRNDTVQRDTPLMPRPTQRCLNSVARSPARTLRRYGNSGPLPGKSRRISATSSSKRMMAIEPVFLRAKLMTWFSQSTFSASRNAGRIAPRPSATPVGRTPCVRDSIRGQRWPDVPPGDAALLLELDGGPAFLGQHRPRQPVHVQGEVVNAAQIDVGGNRANLQHFQKMLGLGFQHDQLRMESNALSLMAVSQRAWVSPVLSLGISSMTCCHVRVAAGGSPAFQ